MPIDDYEAAQIREISRWKSERPSLIMETYRGLTRPISRLLARVVPNHLVHKALMRGERLAEERGEVGDILQKAGASDIKDLLALTLEECDRLARSIGRRSERNALIEGAVPAAVGLASEGVAGPAASVADIPFLLEATIRAIRRIGHCYGFPLDTELDRRFVLAVLEIANEDDPPGLVEGRLGLWSEGGPYASKPDRSDAVEGIEQSVIDDLPVEAVPFLGDLANIMLDYAFVRRADVTARRVFQERRLRLDGKVESIPMAPESHRRSSIEGLSRVGTELAYAGAYGVAFGVTFPASLAGAAVASVAPEPVLRGLRDGTSAASRDASGVLEGFRRSIRSESDGAVPLPSPA